MDYLISWLPIIIPGMFLVWGGTVFLIRLARLKSRVEPDPESLLLGAVSSSLRERGELAANLGELRSVHENLLNALPAGLLWVDPRGVIGALNSAGQLLLNVKPGVIGLEAEFVLAEAPWLLEALKCATGEAKRTTDISGRRWEAKKILTPNSAGSLVQFEDVTEIEAEEKRRALQDRFAELGQMTAGLAHQLKNSLAVIKGQGQLLNRAGHFEAAEEILQEATSLERLAVGFLDWAKPLSPQLAATDLAAIAEEAITEIRRRPCASRIAIERQGAGEALADSALLREALINIIENACQASSPGNRVSVHVSDSAIEVHDEGSGLGQDDLPRLLSPFESGRPDGTGLGLPLAFKWLSAQRADLSINKREPVGTSIIIRF
jgi:signal transduction histidine kinase